MKHLEQKKEDILEDYSYDADLSFLGRKYSCTRDTMRRTLTRWGMYKPKESKRPIEKGVKK